MRWPWQSRQEPSKSSTAASPAATGGAPATDPPLDLATLYREVNSLRMEWVETLDKLHAMLGRFAARDRKAIDRMAREDEPAQEPELGALPTPASRAEQKAALRRLARERQQRRA